MGGYLNGVGEEGESVWEAFILGGHERRGMMLTLTTMI